MSIIGLLVSAAAMIHIQAKSETICKKTIPGCPRIELADTGELTVIQVPVFTMS
jgi:hypothetical protein